MLPYNDFKNTHPELVDKLQKIRLQVIAEDTRIKNYRTIFSTIGCISPITFITMAAASIYLLNFLVSAAVVTLVIALRWQGKRVSINNPSLEINAGYNNQMQAELIPALLDTHSAQVTWQAKPRLNLDDMRIIGFQFLFTNYFYDYEFNCQHRFIHQTHRNTQKGLDCSLNFLDFGIEDRFHLRGFGILYEHDFKIKGNTALVSKNLGLLDYFGENSERELFDLGDLDGNILENHEHIIRNFAAYTTKISHAYKVLSLPIFQALSMFYSSEWKKMMILFNERFILFFVHNDMFSPLQSDVNMSMIEQGQYNRFNRCLRLFDDVSHKLTMLD